MTVPALAKKATTPTSSELRAELRRLGAELSELQANEEEEQAGDELELHDAQLLRLKLRATVERYTERRPAVEELAERYEDQIDELSSELWKLREENAHLALRPRVNRSLSDDDDEALKSPASSSRSPRRQFTSVKRAQQAAEGVYGEVQEVWNRQNETAAQKRRVRVNEWYLSCLQRRLKDSLHQFRLRSTQLKDLRQVFDEADSHRLQLAADRERCYEELERERQQMTDLHKEVLRIREACIVPAELKKKSNAFMKFLDQEGGRLNTEKHLRGLQAAAKLYDTIAVRAPALQLMASQAKAAMESTFLRYQQLEQQHTRLLQTVNLSVMRDVLEQSNERSRRDMMSPQDSRDLRRQFI